MESGGPKGSPLLYLVINLPTPSLSHSAFYPFQSLLL